MTQVDIFSPFRRKQEHHEDHLTWGFLIALKYSPSLQNFLRNLVLSHIPKDRWKHNDNWEPASIITQTNTVGTEASFIVSVLLLDELIPDDIEVDMSPRIARYDGVIEFADGLVLIIENKLSAPNVWHEQLSPSKASLLLFEGAILYNKAVQLEWAKILEGILIYTESQTSTYAERIIAQDFLAFVDDVHPKLNPYRTFRICDDNKYALKRRIGRLLETIADQLGVEVKTRPGGQRYLQLSTQTVQQMHLNISDNDPLSLRLSVWPGDTVSQARAFLNKVNKESFLALSRDGWEVRPNLHFSHIQKHLVWAQTKLSVEDYLEFFLDDKYRIGRVQFEKDSLTEFIEDLRVHNLISTTDGKKLKENFSETNRSYLNMIPGFQVTYDWPLSEVIELEDKDMLEATLLEALQFCLSTWGEVISTINSMPDTA